MEMANRIKQRRTAMGYTQEELATKLGLQKSAIAKYENGRVENIKRSVISNMAKILECSPAYLMGWQDDRFSDADALLDVQISEDAQLKEAIKKYYALDDQKKKHVIDLINLLSEE